MDTHAIREENSLLRTRIKQCEEKMRLLADTLEARNAQMKELDTFDMIINTQTREMRLRKKEKDEARYDLCRVVNARYFPDEEDSDRDYLRLIVGLEREGER